MKRAYFCEGIFAGKAWGKTTFLARRVAYEASCPSQSAVFVIDPPDSFRDVANLARWTRWTSWKQLQAGLDARGSLPRVMVCSFGLEPEAYLPLMRLAVGVGDGVLVVDECHLFAPGGRKSMPFLIQIAAMGRHLPDSSGDERQTSLICASQAWNLVGLELRTQIMNVVAGQMHGSANAKMMASEVNAEAEEILRRLKPHEWAALRGPMPPLAPLVDIR